MFPNNRLLKRRPPIELLIVSLRGAFVNFDAFVITSNPSLKDESVYHAEQLKTEIRKTNGMKV